MPYSKIVLSHQVSKGVNRVECLIGFFDNNIIRPNGSVRVRYLPDCHVVGTNYTQANFVLRPEDCPIGFILGRSVSEGDRSI